MDGDFPVRARPQHSRTKTLCSLLSSPPFLFSFAISGHEGPYLPPSTAAATTERNRFARNAPRSLQATVRGLEVSERGQVRAEAARTGGQKSGEDSAAGAKKTGGQGSRGRRRSPRPQQAEQAGRRQHRATEETRGFLRDRGSSRGDGRWRDRCDFPHAAGRGRLGTIAAVGPRRAFPHRGHYRAFPPAAA